MIAAWVTAPFLLLSIGQPALPAMAPIAEGAGVEQRLNTLIPLDLRFTDERGEGVSLSEFFGRKPVVLALVYYDCPMLCTLVLNGLVRGLRAISLDAGADFEVVAVSIDPRDTPALAAKKKASYVDNYRRAGSERGWHFLTGAEPQIAKLAGAVGFKYAFDKASGQYAHPAGITVLTAEGRVARYFDGIEYAAKDLRFGLIEASQNRIGTLIDRMLLLCYHYDPTQGKYGIVVINIVRLGGVITLLALAVFVILMLRRERKGKAGGAPEPAPLP